MLWRFAQKKVKTRTHRDKEGRAKCGFHYDGRRLLGAAAKFDFHVSEKKIK